MVACPFLSQVRTVAKLVSSSSPSLHQALALFLGGFYTFLDYVVAGPGDRHRGQIEFVVVDGEVVAASAVETENNHDKREHASGWAVLTGRMRRL